MESAMVGLVVEKLGWMMIEQINKEASLVLNFRKDFEWLSEKLTRIRSYLREADILSAHNESVKSWLLDVAEIALDAEDILDECVVEYEGTDNESPQSSCVCSLSYSQLVFRYVIESGSHPVAIESKVEQVLHLLNDPVALVIAVVGIGGVGKTFLMQNVFNKIKGEFEKSIWLAISQTYSLTKLQAALAMELGLNEVVNGRVDEVKAAELIHGRLASRKFLIVLDDVWRATEQENLVLALGLPRGNNPCGHNTKQTWIACQVEGECGRLPLAVKTVAASLANTTLSREWEFKLEQLRAAASTEDPIMQILKLSYDSLPANLKPCFVHLSFFPEDEVIDYQYLINLWVAEGYIPQGED
ncbi:hypothetical protein SUGI_1026860 [Cryptomeria japonica]|nr:hypothetical protein SUGI_1026860 [Cryptomeria japonica]